MAATVDPRTPVIVGVGQAQQRPEDPASAREPIALLELAACAALDDSGARDALLRALDTVTVVELNSWHYPDPGTLLARRLRAPGVRRTAITTTGGNSPQMLVTAFAHRVARGEADVVLIGGAECIYTRWRARREPKTWLTWTESDDPPCTWVVGDGRSPNNADENAHGANAPTLVYPLFETALRASAGHSVEEHQRHVSDLWATFAATAAGNPHAWSRTTYTPEQIRTPGPDNRMIAFPYPKLMCSNIDVDQSAAILLCSYEAARVAGVADDRMVFPLAGADAHDHWFVTERDRLDVSPALRLAARTALDGAGFGVDDVARFDLYSCFPSAVQIAMGALDLAGPASGDRRPLTVTGGLGFAGGPVNNYVSHSIATMVEECRRDPGSVGLVTGIGWYATKHSVGLYSSDPPARGFVRIDSLQPAIDALPRREPAGAYAGRAMVEATSVVFERDGTPSLAIVSALTPDGRRALANSRDAGMLVAMTVEPWECRAVTLTTDGTTNSLSPEASDPSR